MGLDTNLVSLGFVELLETTNKKSLYSRKERDIQIRRWCEATEQEAKFLPLGQFKERIESHLHDGSDPQV